MVINEQEHTIYGTNAERLADIVFVESVSNKWFDTDLGTLFRSDGTYWRGPGEGNANVEAYTQKEFR